jgi:hypothetical protein
VSAGCASQIFRNAFARNQETNSKQFLRVVQLCISEKRSGALSAIVKVRPSTQQDTLDCSVDSREMNNLLLKSFNYSHHLKSTFNPSILSCRIGWL